MIMPSIFPSSVTLNSFQGPSRPQLGSGQGAQWVLKRVQHDDEGDAAGKRNGFSLVELMVVLFILSLLTVVVALNVLPVGEKAQVVTARADISQLSSAMEMYRLDNMTYPGAGDGLASLRTPPANLALPQNYRAGGYIKDLPNDPWGRPYQYVTPGRTGQAFDIFSLGADGKPGGEGNDADIYAETR